MSFSKYRKTIVAAIGAAIGFASVVVTSPAPRPTAPEILGGVIALATALGVYVAPNGEG